MSDDRKVMGAAEILAARLVQELEAARGEASRARHFLGVDQVGQAGVALEGVGVWMERAEVMLRELVVLRGRMVSARAESGDAPIAAASDVGSSVAGDVCGGRVHGPSPPLHRCGGLLDDGEGPEVAPKIPFVRL
jgi:hypothetical protein